MWSTICYKIPQYKGHNAMDLCKIYEATVIGEWKIRQWNHVFRKNVYMKRGVGTLVEMDTILEKVHVGCSEKKLMLHNYVLTMELQHISKNTVYRKYIQIQPDPLKNRIPNSGQDRF